MGIKTSYGEAAIGWQGVRCKGFKLSKTEDHIIAMFNILANGDNASYVFKSKVKANEVYDMYEAMGKSMPTEEEGFEFPDLGDEDMMGFDTPIMGFVKTEGKYLNITKFQKDTGVPTSNNNSVPF